MKKILTLLFAFLFSAVSFAQTGTLKIKVSGIKSHKGNIKAALYNEEGKESFLKDLKNVYSKKQTAVTGDEVTIIFKNLPYGVYAVSLFQDENNNNILDRAKIGFPIEPYGVSGNKKTFGPPRFDDCKFELKTPLLYKNIILGSFGGK
ncbi:MAG: DUF2141 domain-containing protein [Chlorobi bacterium]|nr:DUF2141 domain-containing protein [Chlorobiota bacterium]